MLKNGEIAEIASATFTAVTAAVAFMSVARVEHDRRNATIPELHIDVIADAVNNEMRMTIANLGPPAREVRTMGTIGDFGWFTPTPPTTFWRSGESPTYKINMPLLRDPDVRAFVEARAVRMNYLVVPTAGGKQFRWPLRKLRKLSPSKEWDRLFPRQTSPLDVANTPMAVELLERHF